MHKIKKKIKLSIFVTIILSMLIPVNIFAASTTSRLSGIDRYETSAKIALSGWEQSNYAILASGENYPDALCAAPLAAKYNAPILLTQKDAIPSSTLSVMQQLKVKTIFIIGGTGVVSQAVENQLATLGVSIIRLFGQDRYETDIAVSKQLGKISQAVVVTGEDYADALSIAPIAIKLNMPIILIAHDYVPQVVKDYLAGQNITKTYVVGKGSSISNINGLANVTEINGQDKYSRNIAIINTFKNSLDFSSFYVATGENYADALSGSVLAGLKGNPVMLTGTDITNQKNLLQSVAPHTDIKILGGTGAVSESTISNLTDYATRTENNSNSNMEYATGTALNGIVKFSPPKLVTSPPTNKVTSVKELSERIIYLNNNCATGKYNITTSGLTKSDLSSMYTAVYGNDTILGEVVNYVYSYVGDNIVSIDVTVTKTLIYELARAFADESYLDHAITSTNTTTAKKIYPIVKEILQTKIKPNMTDYEKEKAIHDYMVANYCYDTKLTIYSIEGMLLNKTGVCQSYADTFSLFMNLMGIKCITQTGTGNGGSHAWNIIMLDSEWYNVDVTWDDPIPDSPGRVLYDYFNVTDSQLLLDHQWTPETGISATSTKYNYYKQTYPNTTGYNILPSTLAI